MNIYKEPDMIISPKHTVYSREGGSAMNQFTNVHSLSHTLTHTHTHTHTHTQTVTVPRRESYWDGKRCAFRATLKADLELE